MNKNHHMPYLITGQSQYNVGGIIDNKGIVAIGGEEHHYHQHFHQYIHQQGGKNTI